jgi:hypothetical protein
MAIAQNGWQSLIFQPLGIQKRGFCFGVLNETTLKTHGLQCGLKVFAQIGQKFGGSGWILAFSGPGNSFLKNCTKGSIVKFFGRSINGSLSGHFHLFFKNVRLTQNTCQGTIKLYKLAMTEAK